MTNAFGVVLDSAGMRRAAAEGVPETVIAAIYLLREHNVDEIAAKLRPDELGHVIRLVNRCPSCYPPGTLEALKVRSPAPSPKPVASISTDRSPARIEPDAEDMRRAKEGRLARLRAHASQTARARERVAGRPMDITPAPAPSLARQRAAPAVNSATPVVSTPPTPAYLYV